MVTKLLKYNSAGVREYWIVDYNCDTIGIYDLANNQLLPEVYTFKDTVKAGIYDDLSINFAEITASL